MYFFKEALCLLFHEGLVKVEGRSRDQVKGGRPGPGKEGRGGASWETSNQGIFWRQS